MSLLICLCLCSSRSSDSPMSVCVSGSQVAIWDALSQMFCLPPLSSAAGIADSNFPLHHLSVPMACITDQSWSLFLLGLGLSSEFVSTQCFRQSLLRDRSRVCRGSYLLSLAFMWQCKAVRQRTVTRDTWILSLCWCLALSRRLFASLNLFISLNQ